MNREEYIRRKLNGFARKRNQKQHLWRVGFAVDWRGENGDELCFVFHGALTPALKKVFDTLKNNYCEDYTIEDEHHDRILNGLCYRQKVVRVIKPDLMNCRVTKMVELISLLLPKLYNCKVRYFAKYEDFLNT